MSKMRSTVTIAGPPEEVFRFFLDLDQNAPSTDPDVEHVVKTPQGPTEPGTTFRLRQHSLGKTRETTTRFTAIERNRKIEFEGAIGPMRPKCSLAFEPTGNGTSVTFSGHSHPVGLLKALSPLFNRKGQQVWTRRLNRIKSLLETPAAQFGSQPPGTSSSPRATTKPASSAQAQIDVEIPPSRGGAHDRRHGDHRNNQGA